MHKNYMCNRSIIRKVEKLGKVAGGGRALEGEKLDD